MTAEQIAELMARPGVVLVPVAVELAPEVLVEWVECDRFRLTARPDGLHDIHVERSARVASA